jgi:hypothetical protein
MTSQDEAVSSLLSIVDKEPYRTTSSWVRTSTYTSDTLLKHSRELEPFRMDERFATPKKQ